MKCKNDTINFLEKIKDMCDNEATNILEESKSTGEEVDALIITADIINVALTCSMMISKLKKL